MRLWVCLLLMSHMMSLGEVKIEDFQWKNRLLVFVEGDEELVVDLKRERAGLAERQLRVFILSGDGAGEFAADERLEAEFKERLAIDGEELGVYLIGKDSRTTLSWAVGDFTFEKLYESIDAMPMRRREMEKGDR